MSSPSVAQQTGMGLQWAEEHTRAVAEPGRPGWRQMSHLGEVVAARAWPQLAAQHRRGMHREPPGSAALSCSCACDSTTPPREGLVASCTLTRLPQCPALDPAKTPRGTRLQASAPAQPAAPCLNTALVTELCAMSLTQPAAWRGEKP